MRLFTGIALPPQAAAHLINLLTHLRPLANLAWTPQEKLHITLKFIGEFPDSNLPSLIQALNAIHIPTPIEIQIRNLGWLPSPRFPLTLYAGVTRLDPLNALAQATEQALLPLGIPAEPRIYRPHVTLARLRARASILDLKAEVDKQALQDFATFQPESFHLYMSAEGRYTKLSHFALPIK